MSSGSPHPTMNLLFFNSIIDTFSPWQNMHEAGHPSSMAQNAL
jgi:hypothetical protein